MKDITQQEVFIQLLAAARQDQSISISYVQRQLRMGYGQACQLHQAMLAAHWIEITAEGYLPVRKKWLLSKRVAKKGCEERLGQG
jgi:DNA segregation ATPase FtsK/SpoIIIE-like protein